jgi:hypothetical protein
MKYLIPVNKLREEMLQVFREKPMRSGFYNWGAIFKAEMREYNKIDDLEKYDVIHVNMSPSDWWMVFDIKRRIKNSSTKLVLNNDHVSEFWHKWELDPNMYLQVQEQGDVVFGTEPYQTSQMIDRAVTIPHPTNIKDLKFLNNTFKDSNKIGFMCHHYDKTIIQRVLMSKKLKSDLKCKTGLYNYVAGNPKERAISEYWFDEIYKQFEFPQFAMSVMRNKLMLELADYHTYGRATVETAALKVPTVGSDRIYSMRQNFPGLCADPYDHKRIRYLTKKLWNDEEFRQEQIDYAYDACEHFNYKNSKERMMKELDKVK